MWGRKDVAKLIVIVEEKIETKGRKEKCKHALRDVMTTGVRKQGVRAGQRAEMLGTGRGCKRCHISVIGREGRWARMVIYGVGGNTSPVR